MIHEIICESTPMYSFPNGDFIERTEASLIFHFSGRRKVLSTSPLNGGYRDNLTHVFNHDCMYGTDGYVRMKGATYHEHMLNTVYEIGLDPLTCAGLETGAQMKNASLKTLSCGDLQVTAITTAGVDFNAGRAGDEASWEETGTASPLYRVGTINTILCINTDLSEGAMTSAMVTCAEAKAAALQELAVPSCYSSGLATGTGTDGTIIVANAQSPKYLTEAGKHAKLGELIGKCVLASVKDALDKQSGLNAARQHDAALRMSRFGVEFADIPPDIRCRKEYVVAASMLAHLLDELDWGLINEEEANIGANWVLKNCKSKLSDTRRSDIGAVDAHTAILNGWRAICNDVNNENCV